MSIFMNQYSQGMRGYDVKSGNTYDKYNPIWGSREGSQPIADEYTARISSWMGRQKDMATNFVMDQATKFADPTFKASQMAKAEESVGVGSQMMLQGATRATQLDNERVSSVAGLMNRRNRQRENLRRARKSIEQGQATIAQSVDPSVAYKATGFKAFSKNADELYSEFDAMINEQKETVAQGLGYESYGSMAEDYQNVEESTYEAIDPTTGQPKTYSYYTAPEHSQLDVDNMVMELMTGMSSGAIRRLDTWKGHDKSREGYTQDFFDQMRTFYTESGLSAVEGINKMAVQEDIARAEQAKTMEKQNIITMKARQQESEEAAARSLEAVKLAEGQSEQSFEKGLSMLTGGKPLKKRKVRSVDFGTGRAL